MTQMNEEKRDEAKEIDRGPKILGTLSLLVVLSAKPA
jgi:hypothetical protein